jgi:glyoxylase-like metal-dependent hydrolase (beta-lactamase superfamily II)
MSSKSFSRGRISCQEMPIQLSSRVWRLGTYHLAVYLVKGQSGSLLFEVGISTTAPVVLEQLAGLGVPKEEIRWVVLTHAHSDHSAGGASLIAGLPKASLILSQATHRHLSKPETVSRFQEEDVFTSSVIWGQDPTDVTSRKTTSPALPDQVVIKEPGDMIMLDGIGLELMGADGHVPGGLTGWLPAEGVLFASDSAGFCSRGQPAYPMYFVSYGNYQSSLAKLKGLTPQILGLGHQDCFSGQAAIEYLDQAYEQNAREHQFIIAGTHSGRDQESLTQDIFQRYYLDELAIYPADTMLNCSRLLVRRSLEHEEG